MTLDLAPLAPTASAPAALRVEEEIVSLPGPFALSMDTLAPGLDRVRDVPAGLRASDARGDLPLGAPRICGDGRYRVWPALRPAVGVVHVEYAMPAALARPRRRGPHVDLQAAGGGLSGSFAGFLVSPRAAVDLRVHWRLPAGSRAVSSLGDGDVAASVTPDQLADALFLAGPVRITPDPPPPHGLALAALGDGARRLDEAGTWYAAAFAAERAALHAPADARFRVLVRSYDGGPIASGRATAGAFLFYLPPGADADAIEQRATVAHELVHSLGNALDDEPGEGGDWYTEGIADYLALVLPRRAGLYTDADYAMLVDREVAGYYTNALRATPNARLDAVMWSGRNAWQLPYVRGALYFADLDAKLHAHHIGMTVVDLVVAMGQRFRAGSRQDNATWAALLRERVGGWAVDDWRAMLVGRLIEPVDDAFGPGLRRVRVAAGTFDLGFAKPVAVRAGERIAGIDPTGNATRAGLREGDVIARDVDINPLAKSFDRPLVLEVRRAGRTITIAYDPHRGSSPGWRWLPRAGRH